MKKIIANITVGRAHVRPSTPSHSPGVREGNARHLLIREPGLLYKGRATRQATARRSTGVNARARNPIDPRMPNLSPP